MYFLEERWGRKSSITMAKGGRCQKFFLDNEILFLYNDDCCYKEIAGYGPVVQLV